MTIDISPIDIQPVIRDLRKAQSKKITKAYKSLSKIFADLERNVEKVKSGAKDIEKYENDNLGEGLEEVARRKPRSWLRGIRALGDFARKTSNTYQELEVPSPKAKLKYEEVKAITKRIGRISSDLDKERHKTDQIMGLDFVIKKRSLWSPLGHVQHNIRNLNELLAREYLIIRALEELEELDDELEELFAALETAEERLSELQDIYSVLEGDLGQTEAKLEKLDSGPVVKEFRGLKRQTVSLELEIGRKLNYFKKPFRKLAKESERSSLEIDFHHISMARKYEEDPLSAFLSEKEGYPILVKLVETLIGADLKLRKSVGRLEHDLNWLKQGKLDQWKKEYLSLHQQLEKESEAPELKGVIQKIDSLEEKHDHLKEELNKNKRMIEIQEKDIQRLKETIEAKQDKVDETKTYGYDL